MEDWVGREIGDGWLELKSHFWFKLVAQCFDADDNDYFQTGGDGVQRFHIVQQVVRFRGCLLRAANALPDAIVLADPRSPCGPDIRHDQLDVCGVCGLVRIRMRYGICDDVDDCVGQLDEAEFLQSTSDL